MNVEHFASSVVLLALAGCATTSDDGQGSDATSGSVDGGASESGVSESSAEDGPGTSAGSSTGGSAGESGDSGRGATETTGGVPLPELCPTARTEDECASLDEACRWYPSYGVLDAETCSLAEPQYACWATDSNGQAGCFDGPPAVCAEMEIRPLYRDEDGVVSLILNTDGPCGFNPIAPPGETAWIECPIDEFRPAPDVCYCLCGGPPDASG